MSGRDVIKPMGIPETPGTGSPDTFVVKPAPIPSQVSPAPAPPIAAPATSPAAAPPPSIPAEVVVTSAPQATRPVGGRPRSKKKEAHVASVYFRDADQYEKLRAICCANGGSVSSVLQQMADKLVVAFDALPPDRKTDRILKVTMDIFR